MREVATESTAPLVALGRRRHGGAPGRRFALRVSVLEQCQLSCAYCRPGSVIPPSARRAWLSPAEHARVARLFVSRGVDKVRFTGGEPLLRPDLVDVVAAWRAALPDGAIALTTNGLLLDERLESLIDAGMDRVNVHIDTLDPERCREAMGGGDPARALAAAVRARRRGLPVKLNVVVQRGVNDDHLGVLLDVGLEHDLEVRFIELMNTGSAVEHVARVFVSGAEILERVRHTHAFTSASRAHASDPALRFTVVGRAQSFGLIASDTMPFCDACDRLRLSADGRVRGCLFAPAGLALGGALRAGADDDDVAALLDAAIAGKRSWHDHAIGVRPSFSMADVGG